MPRDAPLADMALADADRTPDLPATVDADAGDLAEPADAARDMVGQEEMAPSLCCPKPEQILAVDPRATFLYRSPSDDSGDLVPLDLMQAGFCPGDTLSLRPVGMYDKCGNTECLSDRYIVVFTTSDELLGISERVRVQGALATELEEFMSQTAAIGGGATDIPEDFVVEGAGVDAVKVPAGARFMFAAGTDSFFEDNSADMVVGVKVACVP